MKIRFLILLTAIILALSFSGCGNAPVSTTTKGPITVGSKVDTEGTLLAQIIILMLRDYGFTVNDRSATGQTPIVRRALLNGEIDIYPEYTGNGAFFFNLADSPVWQDFNAGYQKVKELDKTANNVIWLQPAPANNTWAIAVTKTFADNNNLKTMDDLAAYINNGGVFKLAASEEFLTSQVALPAFEAAYGFSLRPDQQVVVSTGGTATTEKAAAEGTSGVNAAMAFGTDGDLAALGLLILDDNRHAQPYYAPAPIVRGVVFDKYPELATILNPVFATLDLLTLQTLNAQIQVEGRGAAAVARDYLKSKNFIP
ncbi:glycine betaine ABC transporter substrate-binding protein OsmF [Dehalogenimonas etheniformans]|uniref:ABC transporter substrate-binding protein n=1 Tax=Dehalogenimonas etheniformans TaxID=1536648 RepID=A0A2P5P889_9CHLR|nr:ABC transporter substrate-binding protein [Dehalogenimonas etheniformans]PPD58510.1 ABC transporter substrate-binding protein [Dehalogenimonas etheniformans]QNT76726.1 ABC transporter substrate-binding protein [Dehalogenimonas etheniformans]